MNQKEISTIRNYISGLSDYRNQLLTMRENIQEIGEKSSSFGGTIHKNNVGMILRKTKREIKELDDSIYLLEEELKTLTRDN